MTKALVVVSSRTGNTRIVGHAVADALGVEYVGALTYLENPAAYAECNPVVLGFWNDRGMAPEDMQAVAKTLAEKRIGFFATMGGDPKSERAVAWMEKVTEGIPLRDPGGGGPYRKRVQFLRQSVCRRPDHRSGAF